MDEQTVTVKGVQFRLTTDHAASSYGQPVVVCPDGQALGAADLYETGEGLVSGAEIMAAAGRSVKTVPAYTPTEAATELGLSHQAIYDRLKKGDLRPVYTEPRRRSPTAGTRLISAASVRRLKRERENAKREKGGK